MLNADNKADDGSTIPLLSEVSTTTNASTSRDQTEVRDGYAMEHPALKLNQHPPEKELPPPYPPRNSRTLPVSDLFDFEADHRPLLQKSNHLEIIRTDSSIKGSWLVDTDLQVPTSLLPPLEEGKERPHLHLSATRNSINARVEMCGDESKARAILTMESDGGSVTCRLTNKQNQKIDLLCTSRGWGTHVHLHRGFRGPIKTIAENGSITFSPEITRMMTTFMERDGTRSCFLGEFEGSGYTGEEEVWKGDRLHAESKYGSVKVYYLDEETSSSCGSGSKGFWSRLFS